jgi:uncharacterized membrane protein YfcA
VDIIDVLIYVVISFAAGFLNTVAGGGSFISLSVLIFMGMPGTVANATNRVAILSQNIFAVTGFNSKGLKLPYPYSIYLGIASLAGAVIGAGVAARMNDAIFNRVLAVIMVVVVISSVLERKQTSSGASELMSPLRQAIGISSFFLLGIYGGFIQAGIGFLVIAVLTQTHHFSLVKTNYIKVFAAIIYTGISVVIFAWEGKIEWTVGMILAIGQGMGGWYASRWSVEKGDVWIRRILIVSVIGLAVKLWFFS